MPPRHPHPAIMWSCGKGNGNGIAEVLVSGVWLLYYWAATLHARATADGRGRERDTERQVVRVEESMDARPVWGDQRRNKGQGLVGGEEKTSEAAKIKWSSKKRSSCRGVYHRTVVASKGSDLRGERMITLDLRCVFARLWRRSRPGTREMDG
jgi:hypothetical protein